MQNQEIRKISDPNTTFNWPIFILSLEGDERRRAPLLSTLSSMGLSAQVLIGVDDRKGLPECEKHRVCQARKDRSARPLTDGEFACALSHINAYIKIVEEGLPGAIIFEDDARINAGFATFMAKNSYNKASMILLGHGRCRTRWFCTEQLDNRVRLFRILMMPRLAHAYSVSRVAAQTLISVATPVTEVADWPCDISEMDVLAVSPQLALQNVDSMVSSHLGAQRMRVKIEDSAVRPLNRLKRILHKRIKKSWWKGFFAKYCGRRLS